MKRLLVVSVCLSIIALAIALGAGANAPKGLAVGSAIKGLAACGNGNIPANDDGSSAAIPIGFPVNFFGQTYTTVFVNNNGNVTFDGPLATFTPFNLLSTTQVIIAPFFADVDTAGAGSGLTTFGRDVFGGRAAFCANWVNVGYYDNRTDKLNSFQLLLVERADRGPGDFDIMFNYNSILWETGEYSGGIDGLGGSSARAGYSNGTNASLELPGSAVNGALLNSSASGLANNSRNSGVAGRYIFEVRNGSAPTGGSISGRVISNESGHDAPVEGSRVQACLALVPAPPCQVTTSNVDGGYLFSGLAGNGNYFVTAFPPSGSATLGPRTIGALYMPEAGSNLIGQDIKLIPSVPPPPGVNINTPYRAGDGTPAISRATGASFSQSGACTGGSGSWAIRQNGALISSGPLTESSPGTYKGTIPPGFNTTGRATMNITISCPVVGTSKNDDFDVYLDPSGTVLDQSGHPVAGATVTLYRSESGIFGVVPDGDAVMSPSNRANPDQTSADGEFHWDVIAGEYKVRAEKSGCHAPGNAGQAYVETAVLTIPPPALDLELRLECGGVSGPTSTRTPAPHPSTPTPPASEPGTPGDADCSGSVNSIDSALVLQYVAGLIGFLRCPDDADANGDGRVNSIDSALILQYGAGLLPSL
jgi:hypothetical protein